MFFGMFTSHSRVHGFSPREPWEFSEEFLNVFRKMVEMRYQLMPYIFTQANVAAINGWPMLKAMFLNYPDDPSTWNLEDQYMFGEDMLIAPLIEENTVSRNVYLPKGKWIDYLTGKIYEGGQWIIISAALFPGIVLVKYGSVIPHIALAQSTAFMDWSTIDLVVFDKEMVDPKKVLLYLPNSKIVKVEIFYENEKIKINSLSKDKIKFSGNRFDKR